MIMTHLIDGYPRLPEVYLEQNLILLSVKNLIMFQISPDVRNWEQKQVLI